MPRFLSRWFASRPVTTRKRRTLDLQMLENRDVPATRLVVPHEAPADGVTTFHSAASAMVGVAAGDTIQIEPGSRPGTLSQAQLANVANLTIQGNPAAGAQDAGSLVLAGNVTIDASRAGLTFRNLHVINSLPLTINAKVTMERAIFEYTGNGTTAIQINGTANVSFRSSTFLDNHTYISGGFPPEEMIEIAAATGSSNQFIGNTFYQGVSRQCVLYESSGLVTITDLFEDNIFNGYVSPSASSVQFATNLPLSGLVIRNNTFTDPDATFNGPLSLDGNGSSILIERNLFDFHPIQASGSTLRISSGTLATGNIVIRNNRFDTDGFGIGLQILSSNGNHPPIRVEGNDFNNNQIGALLTGNVTISGVDFGGGATGSLGGNNFRTFGNTSFGNGNGAFANRGAIVADGGGPEIQAQRNLFNVGLANGEIAVRDQGDEGFRLNLVVTNSLTGNAGFVQALYGRFLQRTGNTSLPGDAGQFVTSLNSGTPSSTVASIIARSAEAYGLIVDKLYITILGRQSDVGGRNHWIGQLQSGVKLESVQAQFFASREFEGLAVSNAGFVAALYARLLGRAASEADINNWINQIQAVGRQNVALAILNSAEHRFRIVQSYYFDLLHRTVAPSVAEVNSWVNSGQDLYTIKVTFAGTAEFGTNG